MFEKLIIKYGLYLAWLAALIATLGSLYFSEVLGYKPCELCWFQRVCMFPLVIILGMASYREDEGIVPYALVLSSLGFILALLQLLEQYIPSLVRILPCSNDVPCSGNGLSFIPFLSLVVFAGISFLLILLNYYEKK